MPEFLFSNLPVEDQVREYVAELTKSVPKTIDAQAGKPTTLGVPTVFWPEHKEDIQWHWLAAIDPWTVIRGSEGEPEMASVLRPGSVVDVLELVQVEFQNGGRWFWQVDAADEATDPEATDDYLLHNLRMETNARDRGRQLTLTNPVRMVFAKVRVVAPGMHSADLVLTDPCGFAVDCGDRGYAVADPEDLTGGYLETPGAVGYVFLQNVCEGMEWTLADAPEPTHPDHAKSHEHQGIWDRMQDLKRYFSGAFGTDADDADDTADPLGLADPVDDLSPSPAPSSSD